MIYALFKRQDLVKKTYLKTEITNIIGDFKEKHYQEILGHRLYCLDDLDITEVLTSDGFRKFHGVKKHTKDKGFRIFTENTSIECTEDHKFFRGEFVHARDLKIDDILWVNGKEVKVQRIEKIDTPIDYYDLIEVEPHHHFTANGIEVSNCAWIPSTKYEIAMDAVLPSQAATGYKKNIILSTPHGINHFTSLVNGAKKKKVLKEVEPDEIVLMSDGTKKTLQEAYEEYYLQKETHDGEYT